MLVAIEDKSIGTNSSSRVRMAYFYGSVVNDGNWQFRETKEYLSQSEALGTNDPNVPRVVIPNYINGPPNCVARSKYDSVCCINVREDLIDNLQHRFGMKRQGPTCSWGLGVPIVIRLGPHRPTPGG